MNDLSLLAIAHSPLYFMHAASADRLFIRVVVTGVLVINAIAKSDKSFIK